MAGTSYFIADRGARSLAAAMDATTDDDFDEQEEIGRWEMGVFHL